MLHYNNSPAAAATEVPCSDLPSQEPTLALTTISNHCTSGPTRVFTPSHSSQGFPSQRLSRAAVLESDYSIPVPDLTNRQLCRKHSLGLAWLRLPQKALNAFPSPSPFAGVRPVSRPPGAPYLPLHPPSFPPSSPGISPMNFLHD